MTLPPTLPNADRLRAFAVFAEHLNFTHAARALGLSQPALHAQINQLGEALGAPLYRRAGRALILTDAGAQVWAYARAQFDAAAALSARLQGQTHARPARLSAGEGAFLYVLADRLRDLPGGLVCDVADAEGALHALRTGAADVAVTPAPPPADLDTAVLCVTHPVLQVPADHPLAAEAGPVTPQALAGCALVVPPPGRPLRARLDEALAAVPWRVAVEARGWPLTLRFVALGLGAAVVNDCVPSPAGTRRRPIRWLPPVTYRAVRLPEGPRPPAAQALWAALQPIPTNDPPPAPQAGPQGARVAGSAP